MKKIYLGSMLLFFLFRADCCLGQLAYWNFFEENSSVNSNADFYNSNLDASGLMTRGSSATSSAGGNSFRTTGFGNDGISTANNDYFEITLSAANGNQLSITTIDANLNGTAPFADGTGVTNQFAYSLDGTNFTLIGSPQITVGVPAKLNQVVVSGISALQNIAASVTVTLRYYASGQTTTGGWGFFSMNPAITENGLSIGGTVSSLGASVINLSPGTQDKGPFCNVTSSGIALTYNTAGTVTAPEMELSNASGSFASGTTIIGNTVSGTGPYTITGNIPADHPAGAAYRVRIKSTDAMPVVSADNGSDIIIFAQPAALPSIGGGATSVCVGDYTPAFTNSTAGGIWTSSNSTRAIISSGGVVAGLMSGTVDIIYTLKNGTCETLTSTPLLILDIPADPVGTITGTNPACISTSLSFPASTVPDIVYYWQTSLTGVSTAVETNGSANYPVTASGTYYVRAYNTATTCWGGTVSQSVVINSPVIISSSPSDQVVGVGFTASFTVTVSSGTVSAYQWQVDAGSGFADVTSGSGATTATYTTEATTFAMSGYRYRCIVKGKTPCSDVISSSATLTVTVVTTITDYFRSNVISGSWSAASSWQSSTDSTTWFAATTAPTLSAASVDIRTGHTIILTSAASARKLTVEPGAVLTNTNTSGGFDLTIADEPASVDFRIFGLYELFGTQPTFSGGASAEVYTGAIVRASDNIGGGSDDFARRADVIFYTGSVFEWNTESPFQFSGDTYFASGGSNIPVFRISISPGFIGGGSDATINGLLQVNAPLNLQGSGGKKFFRNGICGSSTLTQGTSGAIHITSAGAILGGINLSLLLSSPLNLTESIIVPVDSIAIISGANINNNLAGNLFTVDGTLDVTDINISNTNGSILVNGKYRTASSGGFSSGTITGSSIPSGTINVGASSTVELYANSNQGLNARGDFANLVFSGAGTKTISSGFVPVGTVFIKDNAILDISNFTFGSDKTGLNMSGGRFRLAGTGLKPDIDNLYKLSSGVIEFYNTAGTPQNIKGRFTTGLGTAPILYHKIEVTGSSVGQDSVNITLADSGSFRVKSTGIFTNNSNAIVGPGLDDSLIVEANGIFRTGNSLGFNGSIAGSYTPSVRDDIDFIVLQPNSTVEYVRDSRVQADGNQNITNGINYQHLVITGNDVKTAPAGTIVVKGNLTRPDTTTCTFAHNNGKVLLNGNNQFFSGLPYCQLELTGGIKTTAGGTISCSIDSVLQINSDANLTISNADSVTIKSNVARTASVAELIGTTPVTYTGSGKFVIERYLLNGRKWRLLSVPDSNAFQSIRNSWQENGLNIPGYGFQAADVRSDFAARGFDQAGNNTSVKVYNGSDSWLAVDSTNSTNMNRFQGYIAFVPGDRSITGTGSIATTFRTSGAIFTGDRPDVNIAAGQYTVVGNPYPSRIDIRNISFSATVDSVVAVWDPSLGGTYGLGAWNYIFKDPAPPVGTGQWQNLITSSIYGDALSENNFIESGMAFMMKATGSAGSVKFTESAKTEGSNISSFTAGKPQRLLANLSLDAQVNTTAVLLDAVMADFHNGSSNDIDADDIKKMLTFGEQVSWKRNDSLIVVERRKDITDKDTLYLNLQRLKQQNYQWEIIGSNLDYPGRTGYLVDQYKKTSVKLQMEGRTLLKFNVENIPASYSPDRFYIVFRQEAASPQPLVFTSVKALRNANNAIKVEWSVSNESGISEYKIERSNDGINFNGIGNASPAGGINGSATYQQFDAQPFPVDNFYRIRAGHHSGIETYSAVVKVSPLNIYPRISLFPNPITNNQFQLRFAGQEAGIYQLKMMNATGQQVFSSAVTITGNLQAVSISLPERLSVGKYHLWITGNGKNKVIPVIIAK